MTRLFRLVPAAILTAAIAAVGVSAIGFVTSALVQVELTRAAQRMAMDHQTACAQPPRTAASLAAWFDENFHTTGSRSPANDLWDQPYRIRRSQRSTYTLWSTGPNASNDQCSDIAFFAAIESWLSRHVPGTGLAGLPELDGRADDICVPFELGDCLLD